MAKRTVALFAAYASCVPAANWMIDNVGTEVFPGGPHTIPVGFGYQAPSGVLIIGLALFVRDLLHRAAGRNVAVAAIAVGVALSYVLANPAIATASAVAFCVSELADLAIYAPLARRRLVVAVVASGVIGGVIDSLLFLQIAFGSTDFWQGQVLGKTYMALLGGALIWGSRRAVSDRIVTSETGAAR
jgi:uncharacterized PurR-regulated membrane protein YhhQ (DUF165 family)